MPLNSAKYRLYQKLVKDTHLKKKLFATLQCANRSLFQALNMTDMFPLILEKIKEEFEKKFGKQKVESINPQELLAFRDLHFDIAGTELEDCEPTGWQPKPPKIARIKDDELREFALFLNKRWKLLCRRVSLTKNVCLFFLCDFTESPSKCSTKYFQKAIV